MPNVYGKLNITVSPIPGSEEHSLQLDWPAEDGTYYFVEHTEDLLEGFGSIKLFAGSRANSEGKLGVSLQSTGPVGFYRLFITDDENHPRLLADDDGDKISNLLEAKAGWDAYEQPADLILDTDNDGLPDYWEQFYFGSLEHDGDYIAVNGGLKLSEAFARAINPKVPGSGGEDGWPYDPNFAPARQSERYVLIDLSNYLPYPTSGNATVQVDDNNGVLLASMGSSGNKTTYVTKYYNWSQTLSPSAFNATLETGKAFKLKRQDGQEEQDEQNGTASAGYSVHLTRSGLIHFRGTSSLNEDLYYGLYASDIRNHRGFHDPFNVTYDTNNQMPGTFTNLSSAFSTAGIETGDESNEETVSLKGFEYSNKRTASISMSASDISSETTNTNTYSAHVLMQNGLVLSSGTTEALFDNSITLKRTAHFWLHDTGAYGTRLATHYPEYDFSPGWDFFPFIYPAPDYPENKKRWAGSDTDGDTVISAQGQDILIETTNGSAHSYSLNGSAFRNFQVWNPRSKQLESSAVGESNPRANQ